MANNVKYVIDDGKNKFAAYDAESVDSLLNEKVNNGAFNSAVEELEGEIEQKANTEYVNEEIARIETIIEDLPEPMIFKGTLGTGGTIQDLPTASASNEGFTYKVITDGTYAGQFARVGDVFISNGSAWVLVPAGDDFNDTWRAIKVNGTEVLNNAISSGAVNFNEGDQLTITFDAETKTLNFNVVNTYTKQEVDDIIYDVLPDGTASGAIANFNTSLQLPIKSMQIDVNAKQDLHGYGYPWTAGGGKNLLKTSGLSLVPPSSTLFSNATKRTFASNSFCLGLTSNNYFQNNKVTQYLVEENNISVTSSANAYAVLIPITNLNIGETYTLSASSSQGKMSVGFWEEDGTFISNTQEVTSGVLSFTVPQNTFYVGLSFNPRSNDVQATFTNIQLEKGSTATAFAPYSNICPIEGWSEIKSVHTGKNLITANVPINREYWGTSQADIVTALNTLPVGTYTISNKYKVNELPSNGKVDHGRIYITAMVNGTQIPLTTYNATTDNSPYVGKVYQESGTFTITEANKGKINHAYLYCDQNATHTGTERGKYDFYELQLELGSTATDYEPYVGNEYIINLGDTYYGGKLDVKTGKFLITYEKANMPSRNATAYGGLSSRGVRFPSALNGSYRFARAVCNMARVVYSTNYVLGCMAIGIDNAQIYWFGIIDLLGLADLDAFKTWLDNNPVEVYYEIATPIIIDLPDGAPINTYNGINNFFADSGDTTVTFKQSVNDAINAALNAANNNRMLGMINMSKGNEFEEKEETKEDLTEQTNEK